MNDPYEDYPQLKNLIDKFILNVRIDQPSNLELYAAEYFSNLAERAEDKQSEDDESMDETPLESDDQVGYHVGIMTDRQAKRKLLQTTHIPRQSIISEPFDPSAVDNDAFEKSRRKCPKTDGQLRKIREILKTIFLFNSLEECQIAKVIESMAFQEVFAGEIIINEDDPGEYFYIIDNGEFTAFNKSKTIYEKYHGEGFFGELALLYNCPRVATVSADTDGGLWNIDRVSFRQLILKSAYDKRKRLEGFLQSVPILKELNDYDRCNLADALKPKSFHNEKIISEGDIGDTMYFIEEGEVIVTCRSKNNEEREENRLYKGDYFGEVALLAKVPRIASIYAVGTTKVQELDVGSYNRLMGPCIELMKDHFNKYRSDLDKLLSKEQLNELFPGLLKSSEIA